MTQLASVVFKYPVSWRNKKTLRDKGTTAFIPPGHDNAAMYNCIRHLPDVRYDVMSRATTVGNALPAVAFLSRDQHTTVFTGPYPGPEGPDTRYTSISGTKRLWLWLSP